MKKLWEKICQISKWVIEAIPLRTLWQIWALANLVIIFVLVVESIFLSGSTDNISRALLGLYLGEPQCRSIR